VLYDHGSFRYFEALGVSIGRRRNDVASEGIFKSMALKTSEAVEAGADARAFPELGGLNTCDPAGNFPRMYPEYILSPGTAGE
jgi:hypothetical protein